MKNLYFIMLLSVFATSCSKGGGGSSATSPSLSKTLSKSALMKSELKPELKDLQVGNYAISDAELQALKEENLINGDEKKALEITQ